jgi:hypothetical protein
MSVDKMRGSLKGSYLLAVSVALLATSTQAAEGCKDSTGKLERVAVHTLTATVDAPATAGFVRDNSDHLSNGKAPINSYLALHCEAVSSLPLSQTIRAYHSSACGDAGRGNRLQ